MLLCNSMQKLLLSSCSSQLISFPPPQRLDQISCILQNTVLAGIHPVSAECTHRPLQERQSLRNTIRFCVLDTCQMSQIDSEGGNDHHNQVKKAFQCWLSSSHSICSAFFITSLQFWMLLTSKGRGWNCYARACSSLANSIKYSRKSSSLIEPNILWLN